MPDKKKTKFWIMSAGGVAAALGAVTFLVAPGKSDKKMRAPFMGRNFAHRGLHKIDKSIPENSLPAFDAAARIGYGVELDVHITSDGELVVFHDNDLLRICGVERRVEDMTWPELRELRLCGTEYGIPLFSEVLRVINNRSAIIVELKRGGRNKELCKKTYKLLKDYGGRYCIESFDPAIVLWFRLHAPQVLRGQLASNPFDMAKGTNKLSAFLVGNLLTNFIARPHFIAYGLAMPKPLTVRYCEFLGAMRVAWTSREWKNEQNNDAVIFQFYRPRVKYK
ncbi:MAG: glycerophosphodiester phosphodiesterase family protein [Oscillospiraceae bacterium]